MQWLLVALLSLWLSGCGGMLEKATDSLKGVTDLFASEEEAEPPAALTNIKPEVQIEIVWQTDVGDGYGEQNVRLVPVVTNERVFAAAREGLVEAHDAASGDLIWEVETELPLSSGPDVHYGQLLLGTSDGEVIALDPDNGDSEWTTAVSSEVLALPRSGEEIVVVRTIDGRIIGLNERSGERMWSYERTVPALSLRGTGAPAIVDSRVIAGYASGKLVALRLTDGKLEWEANVALPQGRSELDRLVDIDTDPVVVDDVVYLCSFQAGLFAVSIHDGDVLWQRRNLSSFAGMSADWRYLYITGVDSDVWAVDQRSSAALWKQDALHRRKLTAPAIYKNYLVVGDFEGYLHFLSLDDGRLLGRTQIGSDPIAAAPVVGDEVLYVYTTAGTLAAVKASERLIAPDEEAADETEPSESEAGDETDEDSESESDSDSESDFTDNPIFE